MYVIIPEEEADSLFWLTVRIPPDTDSPELSAVSAAVPSLRFHWIVKPEEPSGMLV